MTIVLLQLVRRTLKRKGCCRHRLYDNYILYHRFSDEQVSFTIYGYIVQMYGLGSWDEVNGILFLLEHYKYVIGTCACNQKIKRSNI